MRPTTTTIVNFSSNWNFSSIVPPPPHSRLSLHFLNERNFLGFLVRIVKSHSRSSPHFTRAKDLIEISKALFFPKFSERLSSFPLSEVNGKYPIFPFPFESEKSFQVFPTFFPDIFPAKLKFVFYKLFANSATRWDFLCYKIISNIAKSYQFFNFPLF